MNNANARFQRIRHRADFILHPLSFILYSMPGSATAEVIFIAAMMILILIVSFATVYFFFRQYKKEMRQREARKVAKAAAVEKLPE